MKKIILILGVLFLLTACTYDDVPLHTVMFESNGGSVVGPMHVEDGLSITSPDEPIKDGHTFLGWYEDANLTTSFRFPSGIFEDTTIYAKWIINNYHVVFIDEDSSVIRNDEIAYGSDLSNVIAPVPSKEGYTFVGWDINLSETMPANDLILQAQYTINSYKLTFMDSDETVLSSETVSFGSDLTNVSEPTPTKEGYTFVGWDNVIPDEMPASDVTLRATYNIQLFTLTYVDDDETVLYTQNFYYNTSLSDVTVLEPTKVGYTFTGWDMNLPESMPANDVTITAQYDVNQYDVTFYDDDHTLLKTLHVAYQTAIPADDVPEPSKEGYTFIGWHATFPNSMPNHALEYHATYEINTYNVQYIDHDGSILYDNTFDYQADLTAVSVDDPSRYGYAFDGWDDVLPDNMPANDIVIHAQYVANSHVIRFYDDNHQLLSEATYDYASDLTGITEPTPNKLGYTFTAWDQVIPSTMPNEDLSFTATYEIITYDITYEVYGGINDGNPTSYTVESESIVFSDPTKEGYTFSGWYETDNYSGSQVNSIIAESTGDITVHAKWDIISYDIIYVLDGGVNGSNPDTYDITSDTMILADATKEGYTFNGWFDNEVFTGDEIESIASGSTGDITLYAHWEVNEHSITYVLFDTYDPLTDIALSYEETVIAIAAGHLHTLALTSDGHVSSWGFNLYGQLGDTDGMERHYPKDITDAFILLEDEQIIAIAAGYNSSIALTSQGRVFTFGENTDGQLGDETTMYKNTPTDITAYFSLLVDETITAIYMGGDNAAALTSLGRVFTWGDNSQGQLGDGTTIDKNTPTDITAQLSLAVDETVQSMAIANKHYILYTSDNRVFSWGYNSSGQVGNGSITSQHTPLDITSQFNFSEGESIVEIATGELHTSLVTSMGRLFMWGENMNGQLGDGTTIDKNTPTDITLVFMYELAFNEKINHVVLTEGHTMVMTSEQRVYAWGKNNYGQVGDETNLQRTEPVEITTSFDVESNETIQAVFTGMNYSFAITSSSHVFGWGYNAYGQLGNGSTTTKPSITSVPFKGVYEVFIEDVAYNEALTAYTPTRVGFSLDAWYTDDMQTTTYMFSTMPDQDLMLYGRWVTEE